ncbi:MAG: hypothetical protein CVU97_06365, partial [Firmicutes bacterium HGW-Firmicutes-21]
FSSRDIKGAPEGDKIKTILPLVMRSIMLAIAFGVFCYSVFGIAVRMAEDKNQENAYGNIRPNIEIASAVAKPAQLKEPNKMPTLLEMIDSDGNYSDYVIGPVVDPDKYTSYHSALLSLSAKYPDVYGWIVFTGTAIDYPIMLGNDNSFYLHHDYKGVEVKSGSIFADYSLSPTHRDNYNALIYGHCMTNGSMFRGIKLWYDKPNRNTLANDMQIEIYTKDAVYIYELFSAYRSDDFNFDKTKFSDEADYLSYLKEAEKRSTLKKKVAYSSQSKICTLITCTNVKSNPDERYVVHGILRQIIPYE